MAIVLLIIGAILVISAIRGTHKELGELWKVQFSGPGSFTAWAFAPVAIGTVGSIEQLRPLARAFLVLVLVLMIVRNSNGVNLLTLIQAQIIGKSIARNTPGLKEIVP